MQKIWLYCALMGGIGFSLWGCSEIYQPEISPLEPEVKVFQPATRQLSGFAMDNAGGIDDYTRIYRKTNDQQSSNNTIPPKIASSAEVIPPLSELEQRNDTQPAVIKAPAMEDQKPMEKPNVAVDKPTDIATKQLRKIFSELEQQQK